MAQQVSTSSSIRTLAGASANRATANGSIVAHSLSDQWQKKKKFLRGVERRRNQSGRPLHPSGTRETTGSHLMRQTVQTYYLHYTYNFSSPPPRPPLGFPPCALFITPHERTFLGVIDVRGNWAFHVEPGPAPPAVSLGTHSQHQVG